MCGRYATTRSAVDLTRLFAAADETDDQLAPDYNVAPTDPVPMVRLTSRPPDGEPDGAAHPPRRVLSVARWGLVPHWAKDPRAGARMINARSETVAGSAAFGRSFAARRCLIPADGWYEWFAPGRPYFMTPTTDEPLVFAGLWAASQALPGRLSCTVLTTEAVGEFRRVHDRMPLLLPRQRWEQWLTAAPDDPHLLDLPPADLLATVELRPVGPAVGDVRNDGPRLVARVASPPEEPQQGVLFPAG